MKNKNRKKWRQSVSGGLARLTGKKATAVEVCYDPKGLARSETGSLTLPAELCLPKEIDAPQQNGRIAFIIVVVAIIFIALITVLVATSPKSEKASPKDAPAQTEK